MKALHRSAWEPYRISYNGLNERIELYLYVLQYINTFDSACSVYFFQFTRCNKSDFVIFTRASLTCIILYWSNGTYTDLWSRKLRTMQMWQNQIVIVELKPLSPKSKTLWKTWKTKFKNTKVLVWAEIFM